MCQWGWELGAQETATSRRNCPDEGKEIQQRLKCLGSYKCLRATAKAIQGCANALNYLNFEHSTEPEIEATVVYA